MSDKKARTAAEAVLELSSKFSDHKRYWCEGVDEESKAFRVEFSCAEGHLEEAYADLKKIIRAVSDGHYKILKFNDFRWKDKG